MSCARRWPVLALLLAAALSPATAPAARSAVAAFPDGPPDSQENCDAEAKLLLAPSQLQPAIAAFNAQPKSHTKVYFFDTGALDLLSQGAIVRLRQNDKGGDLIVKLRLPHDGKITPSSGGKERCKCEFDVIAGVPIRSYTVATGFSGVPPETGEQLAQQLSPSQKRLLEQAAIAIDWTRVKRISGIQQTDWGIAAQPPLPQLTLERWEWPGGEALEVSGRFAVANEALGYAQLQQLVASKGISVSKQQSPKTTLALESITHAAVHQPSGNHR